MADRIGVFGGSGLYALLDDVHHVELDTPFGAPSAPLAVGSVPVAYGPPVEVVFVPRHGRVHELPPHRVNYRANLWAMREMGVTRILAPFACGSLQPHVQPGEVVICDQFVDRTSRRASTFFDGPLVFHASLADPYCPELRALAAAAARGAAFTVHEAGTVVVVEGPRFSTRAESASFRAAGWSVINMTQCPEAVLARELGMCFAGVAYVTDYDAGIEHLPGVAPVTQDEVFAAFDAALPRLRSMLLEVVRLTPVERGCGCASGAGPVEDLELTMKGAR